jgi:two-component system, OmpR family, response regulator
MPCPQTEISMRILIVEDDQRLARLMVRVLAEEHLASDVANDGDSGLELALRGIYDVAIIDWILPGRDGPALCRAIRSAHLPTAILMLTARGQLEDRVAGLDSGADDYLVKPFALVELLARVRALTRRQGSGVQGVLKVGSLELDRLKRTVRRGDRVIPLAPRQFRLLEYLLLNTGRAVSRSELLREVWNLTFDPESNLVDAHISTLRSALERAGEGRLIHTVRGVGYTLKSDSA